MSTPKSSNLWMGSRLPEAGDVLGDYCLVQLLGKGAMGAVYEATRLADDAKVALKILFVEEILADPAEVQILRKRFVREAKLLGEVKHRGLPMFYDADQGEDWPYFAMELLHGKTLEERMRTMPCMSIRDVLGLGITLAETLQYVFEQTGAIHRDLKPANVFLLDDSRVKLLDFGIAKVLEGGEGTNLQTRTGMTVGTLRYMAPEQHVAAAVDRRTDVFALGAMLFELLTFQPPFDGQNVIQIYESKMGRPKFRVDRYARELSKSTAELIHAMLAPDPADRPADYREIVAELERARAALPPGPVMLEAMPTVVRTPGGIPDDAAEAAKALSRTSVTATNLAILGMGTVGCTRGQDGDSADRGEIVCELRKEWATAACLERLRRTAETLEKAAILGVIPWQVDLEARVLRSAYVIGPEKKPLDLDQGCRNHPGGRLPESSVAKLGVSLLAMLHHLHEAGLVHGNVKPQNVLFEHLSDTDGLWRTRPKLVGAAIVPALGSQKHVEFLRSETAGAVGHLRTAENRAAHDTLNYLSPERLAGAPASESSDVYSVARVLLRALTGSTEATALGRLRELAPEASAHWAPILGKAMRDEPNRRFDALEMAEYVHTIVE